MRVLCLHGIGTSAKIFDAQMRSVTSVLKGDGHEFVFVDGLYDFEAEDDVRMIYPPPYLSWFESPAPRNIDEALEYLQELIDDEGPFDGIMAFSQGGCLASSYILQQDSAKMPFKFAIFLCSLLPCDDGEGRILIPTLHVVGKMDPLVEHGRLLAEICDGVDRTVIEHAGGHEMPRDVGLNKEIANAVSMMMARASIPAA